MPVDDSDRFLKQGLGTRPLRDHRGAGGQGDKGVQVGGLGAVAIRLPGNREPAAVLGIVEGMLKPRG